MIHFDINKTIQATAYLLKRKPGHCENYMKLLKLLYIADRTSLQHRGIPICGDTPYAMARGPVFGATLDLIKGKDPLSATWEQFIERCNYDVHLKSDPGNLHLSPVEIDILERVAAQFQAYDEWAMVRWCHRHIPEYQVNWKKRQAGEKRRAIPFEDVLREIGRLPDQERIIAEINENMAFNRFFSHHMPANGAQA